MVDRHDEHDPVQPDPGHDEWSAWLPQLDPPATTPTPPATPATTPPAGAPPAPAAPAPAPPSLPPSAWASPRQSYAVRFPAAPTPPPAAAPGAGPAFTSAPPNYLGSALLCTILCFLPFGIVALVKAVSVNTLWATGRVDEARRASHSARRWCLLAALVWPGLGIALAALFMLIGFARVFA